MAKKVQKKKTTAKPAAVPQIKDFLDMAAPSVVKFNSDHAVIGGAYHSFMALRGYPAATEEPALLSHLGAEKGVYIQQYIRQVTAAEERQIIQNASNRSRLNRSNTNDLQQSVAAESDLRDMSTLVTQIHRDREPLDHCAVFIDASGATMDDMRKCKDTGMKALLRIWMPRSICSWRKPMPGTHWLRPTWAASMQMGLAGTPIPSRRGSGMPKP